MATEIQFRHFGWFKDGTSDKIWGWFTIGDKVYNFWGPRGSQKLVKLKFKQFTKYSDTYSNEYEVKRVTREKRNKGYRDVDLKVENDVLVEVEKIYPGFTDHLKKSMFIAKLSGTIMGVE